MSAFGQKLPIASIRWWIMKCPYCGATISVFRIARAKNMSLVICNTCKRQVCVNGLWAAFTAFMVFSVFAGFPYPDSLFLLILLGLVQLVGLYLLLFFILVDLAMIDEVKKPHAS